jgi:hypothetical protein
MANYRVFTIFIILIFIISSGCTTAEYIESGKWGDAGGIRCRVVNIDTQTLNDGKHTVTVELYNNMSSAATIRSDSFRIAGKTGGQYYSPEEAMIKISPGETKRLDLDFKTVLFAGGAYDYFEFRGIEKDRSIKYRLD